MKKILFCIFLLSLVNFGIATATNYYVPTITIHSPEAKNYSLEMLWLNVTAQPEGNYTWKYKINSWGNISFTPNETLFVSQGLVKQCFNNLTVYATSGGQEGSASVQFYHLFGDVDGDRDVDIYDVVRCARDFGPCMIPEGCPRPLECDFDSNGLLNIYDIVLMTAYYGKRC